MHIAQSLCQFTLLCQVTHCLWEDKKYLIQLKSEQGRQIMYTLPGSVMLCLGLSSRLGEYRVWTEGILWKKPGKGKEHWLNWKRNGRKNKRQKSKQDLILYCTEFPLRSTNCPQLPATAAKVAFTEYLYCFFIILIPQLQTGLGWRQEMLSIVLDLTHGGRGQ